MKMFDMKCIRKESEDEGVEAVGPNRKGEEYYPYGLELRLGPESLKKVGMSAKDFAAGNKVRVMAKAKISRVTTVDSDEDNSIPEESVEIQITDLGLQNQEDYETAWDEAVKE